MTSDGFSLPASHPDGFAAGLVRQAPAGLELLQEFNRAGLLVAADVHVAARLLAGSGDAPETSARIGLATALAVRALRVSHVAVDLSSPVAASPGADDEVDLGSLPWPETPDWLDALRDSALVSLDGQHTDGIRPLVLEGSFLYLQRYWQDEILVAESILARVGPGSESPPLAELGPEGEERLTRLFPGDSSTDQRAAARVVLSRRFAVLAGGPGTGKTTAVARILAALAEPALTSGRRPPEVALAAPTGKAAARLEEAVRAEADSIDASSAVQGWLRGLPGTTLHRLLGSRFDRPGRFRHHGGHRLPHDVVVVDEASMVSLAMMARLADALAPEATLILVGDPDQLVSVEAGAVLADIVGPSAEPPGLESLPSPGGPRLDVPDAPSSPGGPGLGSSDAPPSPGGPGRERPLAGAVAVLRRNHRFVGALAELAKAIRAGDPERTLAVLCCGEAELTWIPTEDPGALLGASRVGPDLAEVRERIATWGRDVARAAGEGDAAGAVTRLRAERLLCARRRGPTGVSSANAAVRTWIDPIYGGVGPGPLYEGAGAGRGWYPGRPVLVTANDYATGVYNGDSGVVVARSGGTSPAGSPPRLLVAFDEGAGQAPRLLSPSRLAAAETAYAMTVHKSQGSEFERVTLVLPEVGSRLLTREMVYTAVTRARAAVCIVGQEAALAGAVRTPAARASGLGRRLWPPP